MRISHSCVAGLGLIAAATFFPTHVTAQSQACGPHGNRLVAHLEKEEGERVDAVAFTPSGKLVYVMVNPYTRSYSIVTIAPDGTGCLLSIGDHWEWLDE